MNNSPWSRGDEFEKQVKIEQETKSDTYYLFTFNSEDDYNKMLALQAENYQSYKDDFMKCIKFIITTPHKLPLLTYIKDVDKVDYSDTIPSGFVRIRVSDCDFESFTEISLDETPISV